MVDSDCKLELKVLVKILHTVFHHNSKCFLYKQICFFSLQTTRLKVNSLNIFNRKREILTIIISIFPSNNLSNSAHFAVQNFGFFYIITVNYGVKGYVNKIVFIVNLNEPRLDLLYYGWKSFGRLLSEQWNRIRQRYVFKDFYIPQKGDLVTKSLWRSFTLIFVIELF